MRAVPIVAILTLSLVGPLANAQLVLDRAPFQLTTEGYANVTAARNQGEDNIADAKRYAARADAGLRLLGLVGDAKQTRFGARVELLSTKEDNFAVGERSLLALAPWGPRGAGQTAWLARRALRLRTQRLHLHVGGIRSRLGPDPGPGRRSAHIVSRPRIGSANQRYLVAGIRSDILRRSVRQAHLCVAEAERIRRRCFVFAARGRTRWQVQTPAAEWADA